jgi:hypothetical protein
MLKRWIVSVAGYGEGVQLAPSRGRALADAWRCDAFSNQPFGYFLKHARCRKDRVTPPRYGDPIQVLGKPAFFVDNNRQYVQFAYPGGDHVLNAHPYDVLPVEYRPDNSAIGMHHDPHAA